MTFDAAFDWARRHVQAERLPTAVLGMATADGIVDLEGFGAATDAVYPLFSITKVLTGITATRAIERGLLTPNTPLTEALPQFGASRDDIVRLWHLASHTSGISEPPLDTAMPLRHELLTRGRDFAAGTASRYSTVAFEGIAALIEHATGATWDAGTFDWAHRIGAIGLTLDERRLGEARRTPPAPARQIGHGIQRGCSCAEAAKQLGIGDGSDRWRAD